MQASNTDPQIEDLIDFYKAWPQLRPNALKLSRRPDLPVKDAQVLDWMIRVVDRVGPLDLNAEEEDDDE